MTPTQRTLKKLRDDGYTPGIVERWIGAHGPMGKRRDLFGIIDIIAIGNGDIVGVQSTGTDFSGHHKKITGEGKEALILWLENGGQFWLYAWRKVKKVRGGKQMIYKPRIREYTLFMGDIAYTDHKE